MDDLLASLKVTYDYIIIDCGLQHELPAVNALAPSDDCIIPVQAQFLAGGDIPLNPFEAASFALDIHRRCAAGRGRG